MWSYVLKRLLLIIPTGIGIVAVFFVISELVPGGPLDQVEVMIQENAAQSADGGAAAFRGDGGSNGGGITIDPEARMQIKRRLGLNHDRWERFMRMLLWHSPDSLTSSVEVPDGRSRRIQHHGRSLVVFREGDDYYLYENQVMLPSGPSTLSFDRDAKVFRSSVQPGVRFDARTGQQIDGSMSLSGIPVTVRTEVFNEIAYDAAGNLQSVREQRDEVYITEGFWASLINWDNWHGYFLLKFPNSIVHNKPAFELIVDRLPVSVRLGVISFFLTYLGCLLLGIAKAVRNGSRFDAVTSLIVLTGYGIPGFVLAVFLITMFGPGGDAILNLFPLRGLHSPADIYNELSFFGKLWDNIHHLLAPIICLTIGSFASLTILTKNSVLEEFDQLYATAARARGLSEKMVLYKHILRNALIPLVTGFPTRFVMMFFTGALLIEKIFSLDGIGLLGYTALVERDYPLVISSLFMFTYLGLLCRLLSDLAYVVVDPRINFEEQQR